MNALLQEHGNSRFNFLGFPCNQFGYQEPGANKTEILNGLKFVRPGKGYEPAFELMAKSDVNGDKENPLYTFLKESCRSPPGTSYSTLRLAWYNLKAGDVAWNFEKFLIDPQGKPVARFLSAVTPKEVLAPLIDPKSTSNSYYAKRMKRMLSDN